MSNPAPVLGVGRKFLAFAVLVCVALLTPFVGVSDSVFNSLCQAAGWFFGANAAAKIAGPIHTAVKSWKS